MEAYVFDVLNLLVRWVHMIAGIAWIGASFYFVMLDNSLRPSKKQSDKDAGVFGELWAVHGGGFYHSQKYLTGPKNEPLPTDLHWSKWEAYTTWITGFFLMAIIYWYGAEVYLINPQIMELSQGAAIAISIAFLAGGWLIYDQLCKAFFDKSDAILGIIIFVLVSIAAYALTNIFSGRGAYMTFGAMLGTIMAANVFFVIIPGQKQMVASLRSGQAVDPKPGKQGKQRSVHNTYFTLPVLFTMISNHYAMTYGHEYNWLILIGISLAGALIRIYFVSRHSEGEPLTIAAVIGVWILISIMVVMIPDAHSPFKTSQTSTNAATSQTKHKVDFSQVATIVKNRCTSCHSIQPTQPGFAAPPKGFAYDTDEEIKLHIANIYQQSVELKTMPIGNLTKMTDEERALLGQWYNQINDTQ